MTWDPKNDIYKQFAMTQDRELLLWEEWVKIRKEEVLKLAMNLSKPPVDLVMHGLEWKRRDQERKRALEDAQIAMKPHIEDSLWGKSTRLKQRCPCQPAYEIHQTPYDLRKPPIIEHVGCPDYIKETEKGIFGQPERLPCPRINAEYVKYREEREKKLQKQIAKVDPHRPDISELVVIGRRPKTPPQKIPPLPTIQVFEPMEPNKDVNSGVYALRINDTVVYKNVPGQSLPALRKMQKESWHELCHSWTYYFNVPESKIGRSKLYLQNLGTVALRYCWKKIRKMIPFIPEDIYEQKFFFYKGEDVISPGQSKTLYFTFVSDKAGIYSESWELSLMNVCLFDSLADKFVVHLVGDAVENMKKMTKKIEKLQIRIDRKASEKFIRNLIEDTIIKITSPEHQICPYKDFLLEEEMFELRNPMCFYHQTEVQTMKDLYKEMTGLQWDLTIASWRNAMISKDFEERMMYFETLKESHKVLLKPWCEREDILAAKHRAVKLLLIKLIDKFQHVHQEVAEWNGVVLKSGGDQSSFSLSPIREDYLTPDVVRNVFYMRMYIHVVDFMETIAGVISSIDLYRWIDFDFCQW